MCVLNFKQQNYLPFSFNSFLIAENNFLEFKVLI